MGVRLAAVAVALGFLMGSHAAATPPASFVDLDRDRFDGAEKADGGQRFELDMGTKRANWNLARWSVCAFEEPRDLRGAGGLRLTVTTDQPRADAGMYVAVKEADGSWYYHPWAANLTQPTNVGCVRFEDFRRPAFCSPPGGSFHDENGVLDLDRISAVAIGCVNPLGVGKVRFTLTGLAPVPADPKATDPVAVEVTGKLLDINGTDRVPAGLFGGYAMKKEYTARYRMALDRRIMSNQAMGGGPAFGDRITHTILNCVGERIWPSPVLTEADWKARVTRFAKEFAAKAKGSGKPAYAEFWNEPYLNWANRNRANFNPNFFDLSRAKEGGPVHIKSTGGAAPFLKWTRDYDAPPWAWCQRKDWRRGQDASGKQWSVHAIPFHRGAQWAYGGEYNPGWHPPDDVEDGQTYTIKHKGKDVELTAFTPWHVYDETQFTYWAGKGMLKFYVEPMLAFGKTLKAELPEAVFLVGWGLRASEDHWTCFNHLLKPTIDASIAIIDGVHEHDYGGDALKMAANYEVVTAYGVTKHGKWLTCWNTEQGPNVDPQAYPEARRESYKNQVVFTWVCRKLMHALEYVPDKARAFCHFAFSEKDQGVALELLKNFRGKLVQVDCGDPFVYAVAAIDGTDPQNPRPDDMPQRKELVVAVLNDHVEPREVSLRITAPTGMTFGKTLLRRQAVTDPDGVLRVRGDSPSWGIEGNVRSVKVKLEPHAAVAFTLPVEGEEARGPEVRRRQFFAKTVLADVAPARPLEETVAVDAAALKTAKRGWVRFVAERLAEGEGVVAVNGKDYPLPRANTPDNAPYLRQFPVRLGDLTPKTVLTFRTSGKEHAGYLLGAPSLVLECEPGGR